MRNLMFLPILASLVVFNWPISAQEGPKLGPRIENAQPHLPRMIPSQFCDSTAKIHDALRNKYNQKIVFVGKSDGGPGVLKIYSNFDSGTWTMAFSYVDGSTCIYEGGSDFQDSAIESRK